MDDLNRILSEIGFPQYLDAFVQHDIDRSLFGDLTLEDLKEIGIASLGHRKKLLVGLQAFAEQESDLIDGPEIELGHDFDDTEAERRDVTTIFADLSGYTALSRELDSEDLHDVLSSFYDRFNDIVARMGGTVDRHIGDCVMAVFGAPVSYGNDAERALRTCVEMHRAMQEISKRFGRQLTVHIGAASGNVLFAKSGYGQRKDQDFTLTGDTVNLASRLADQAKAEETLIDDQIFLSLNEGIECDEPVPLEVKGYDAPVLAHRFIGFRRSSANSVIVGRDREVETIRNALDGCLSRRMGETLYLLGEAGIGKTRLVQEALHSAKERGFDQHSALFLDFGLRGTESPVNSIIGSMCGLGENSRQSAIEDSVERLKNAEVVNETSALFLTSILGGELDRKDSVLFGAMSDSARIDGIHEALRQVVRHFSDQTPQLLVVEDLHWADPQMLTLVNILVEESQSNPILVLITSRVEGPVAQMHIAPVESSARIRKMTLEALTPSDAMELAQSTIRVTSKMVDECVQKAQGNPLFLVQMLTHANDSDGLIPSSIQSLIQARFDRLKPTDKKVLQAAAVLGQRFTMPAVTHISGIGVYDERTLVEATLIKPFDEGYLFAHALIRDAILRTILRKDLRVLHQSAAAWFAERDSVLHAQHLDAASDPQAPAAYLFAARKARDAFQKEAALGLAEKGLVSASDPETRGSLLRVKGDVLREMGQSERSITCFREAETCAQNESEICRSKIGIVAAMRILDQIDDAYAVLDKAQVYAEQAELLPELSNLHYLRGCLHFPRGDLDGCQREHLKSLDFAKRANLPERQALALSGLGDAAYARGKMFTAHKVIVDCLELCDTHGLGAVKSANLFMLATVKIYMNETEQALDHALSSAALAKKLGVQRSEIVSRLTAGWILISMAQYAEARSEIKAGLKLSAMLGAKRFEPFLEEAQARVEFGLGNDLDAADLAESSLKKVREAGAENFIGPWVMSTVALTTPHVARRAEMIKEGTALLASGCVGHNYFRFYRNAMQACLNAQELDKAELLAQGLADYTRDEPTPWSDLHILRTRAMVERERGEAKSGDLSLVSERAEAAHLFNAMPVTRRVRSRAKAS